MKTAYDAAYPVPGGVPGTTVVLIYTGGDTPHVWTTAEIAAQPERYRLPVYVRSYGGVSATDDALTMCEWLAANGVPAGTATVLDLETLVDPNYVETYGGVVHAAGYQVLPYGSSSTLFQNPKLDGYFVAAPGSTGMYPNSVATQYGYYQSYDLSWIADTVPLWDTQPQPTPPPAPSPPPPPEELPVFQTATPTGKGYFLAKPDGAVEAFGDAQYSGGLNPGAPVAGGKMNPGATCTAITVWPVAVGGKYPGYWLASSDGGVYAFGGAPELGTWV